MRFKQVKLDVRISKGYIITSRLKDLGFSKIGRQSKKRIPFFGKSESLAIVTEQ